MNSEYYPFEENYHLGSWMLEKPFKVLSFRTSNLDYTRSHHSSDHHYSNLPKSLSKNQPSVHRSHFAAHSRIEIPLNNSKNKQNSNSYPHKLHNRLKFQEEEKQNKFGDNTNAIKRLTNPFFSTSQTRKQEECSYNFLPLYSPASQTHKNIYKKESIATNLISEVRKRMEPNYQQIFLEREAVKLYGAQHLRFKTTTQLETQRFAQLRQKQKKKQLEKERGKKKEKQRGRQKKTRQTRQQIQYYYEHEYNLSKNNETIQQHSEESNYLNDQYQIKAKSNSSKLSGFARQYSQDRSKSSMSHEPQDQMRLSEREQRQSQRQQQKRLSQNSLKNNSTDGFNNFMPNAGASQNMGYQSVTSNFGYQPDQKMKVMRYESYTSNNNSHATRPVLEESSPTSQKMRYGSIENAQALSRHLKMDLGQEQEFQDNIDQSGQCEGYPDDIACQGRKFSKLCI